MTEPDDEEDLFAASFAQERLWLLDRIEGGGAAYNIAGSVRVRGSLVPGAARGALACLVERHESLRTNLEARDGEVFQRVRAASDPRTPKLEWIAPPVAEAPAVLGARRAALATTGFDLENEPLLRMCVVETGAAACEIIVVFHHVIADGWSLEVFIADFARAYEAIARGGEPDLPELAIQYADYAAWQRELFATSVRASELDFWREALAGAPPWLDLPTDRPRRPGSQRGALQRTILDPELAGRLRTLAREESATLFMVLLALVAASLSRWTGADDLVLGTPIANRPRKELEDVIGCFVEMLPLRIEVPPHDAFRALIARAKRTALGAMQHQGVPFGKIVEAVAPPRDPSRTPIFQVAISHQNVPRRAVTISGLSFEAAPIDTLASQFDLAIDFSPADDGGLFVDVEFASTLFDRSTIEIFVATLTDLARSATTDPSRRAGAWPLSAAAVLRSAAVPETRDLVDAILTAAAPERPALEEASGIVLTYATLRARVLSVATAIEARLEAGAEARVALACTAMSDWVIGILGVLAAGAAFVPIDPALPDKRIAALLERARPALVLCDEAASRVASSIASGIGAPVLSLPEAIATAANLDRPRAVPEEAAAYVLYTSGSTGLPKGVVVPRGAIARYAAAIAQLYRLGPEDRLLQFASFSFDVSLEEVFPALLAGSTLVARPADLFRDADALLAHARERRLSVLNLPTAYWRSLLGPAPPAERAPCLRLLVLGGEAAFDADAPSWLAGAGIELRNVYGPTEATVGATAAEIVPELAGESSLSIGAPLPGVTCYVLDPELEPVPIGGFGELFIGGANLARGYLSDPRATAERFLPDPFSSVPGARMYRTGDRVRARSNGGLSYIGRVDRQVKVRGYRIELGDVEAALASHPAVKEAVVRVLRGELVAYVVLQGGAKLEDLRAHLAASLPRAVVPGSIVVLDRLPLTIRGKVDGEALPEPTAPVRSTEVLAPRTATERIVAEAWAEALGVPAIGVEDDLFGLGATSLGAVRVAARLSRLLGREVPVRWTFTSRTVAALATLLESQAASPAASPPRPGRRAVRAALRPTLDPRDLGDALARGELPPIDAAAMSYLPDSLDGSAVGLSRSDLVDRWLAGRPIVSGIIATSLGRIAILHLPWSRADLYAEPAKAAARVVAGLEVAARIGASTVSLTGVIPSATDGGRQVSTLTEGTSLPRISTGHATTTAAVVLAIEGLVKVAGRRLEDEAVAFVGLGSIGRSTLRLLLDAFPHPRRLALADIPARRDALEAIAAEARKSGYRGEIAIAIAGGDGAAPAAVYRSSLVVGATSVPDVVDVARLAPGTLVVDDSAPHCFDVNAALDRIERDGDLLVTEGGALRAPTKVDYLYHWPADAPPPEEIGLDLGETAPDHVMGCALSSLLSAKLPELPPQLGDVSLEDARAHVDALRRLGFAAARPYLEGASVSAEAVARFRERTAR